MIYRLLWLTPFYKSLYILIFKQNMILITEVVDPLVSIQPFVSSSDHSNSVGVHSVYAVIQVNEQDCWMLKMDYNIITFSACEFVWFTRFIKNGHFSILQKHPSIAVCWKAKVRHVINPTLHLTDNRNILNTNLPVRRNTFSLHSGEHFVKLMDFAPIGALCKT